MPNLVHPIEHVAPDLCFGPLIGQSQGLKSLSYDSFVAKHRRFDQVAVIVARTTLPTHPAMLGDLGSPNRRVLFVVSAYGFLFGEFLLHRSGQRVLRRLR